MTDDQKEREHCFDRAYQHHLTHLDGIRGRVGVADVAELLFLERAAVRAEMRHTLAMADMLARAAVQAERERCSEIVSQEHGHERAYRRIESGEQP